MVRFEQFSELDRISHGADVVGQSVPGGRTRMWNAGSPNRTSCAAVLEHSTFVRHCLVSLASHAFLASATMAVKQ